MRSFAASTTTSRSCPTAALDGIQLLTLETSLGWLDIHGIVPGVRSYEALRARADRVRLGDNAVLVASVDDLIAMKQAAGRPQDLIDLEALKAIKRLGAG